MCRGRCGSASILPRSVARQRSTLREVTMISLPHTESMMASRASARPGRERKQKYRGGPTIPLSSPKRVASKKKSKMKSKEATNECRTRHAYHKALEPMRMYKLKEQMNRYRTTHSMGLKFVNNRTESIHEY